MNFLGHAYIARNNPELIAGNFAGDAYKGNLEHFDLPKNIINGVKLHRFIDDYTDHSPYILEAGHIFQSKGIKKITYIATDIIMDHFLAREWNSYSKKDFNIFIDQVYQKTDQYLTDLDPGFIRMYNNLKHYGWFFDYSTEEGIRKILWQFSKRINFENDLPKCMDIYVENKGQFDELFGTFILDIKEQSRQFIEGLSA
ncbi:ACP phosphodiesterase [Paracrocinitomix mangrovi]|uniref:acyl carrier protein phosphodiesterase n=1 Tax=Paracrocinitomix mangrovi TaxID=2862509 RepID=UPI001C8DD227|nr:ACP phosphodiesterase [Paracrocinitomix mangrovi]UKN01839.1 ACP phosphodiesterase [Paracrocinitomix mangrovi]